jgi:hypothetical protein
MPLDSPVSRRAGSASTNPPSTASGPVDCTGQFSPTGSLPSSARAADAVIASAATTIGE